jgi:hypothetical protein
MHVNRVAPLMLAPHRAIFTSERDCGDDHALLSNYQNLVSVDRTGILSSCEFAWLPQVISARAKPARRLIAQQCERPGI